MNNNLSYLWIGNELKRQRELLKNLDKAYLSLKDKSTDYAKGINTMRKVRESIIEILRNY